VLSGCSVFVGGRASVGVSASTDGVVGIAATGELGAGWVMRASRHAEDAHGEELSGFIGTTVGRGPVQIEAGPRVDYVAVLEHHELRVGGRAAFVAAGVHRWLAIDGAVAFARADDNSSARRPAVVGFEVRAGRMLGSEDTMSADAWRAFAGITFGKLWMGATHDPLEGLFSGGK
jgi:hypothetical protein